MSTDSENFRRGRKTLRTLLHEYKNAGSSILVVGDVPDRTLDRASASLLGDPRMWPRTRVFGLFDRNEQTVYDRLEQAGYSRTPTQVVTTTAFARTATTASASTDPDAGMHSPETESSRPYGSDYSLDVTAIDSRDLLDVATALADTFDAASDDAYEPGELRVCIDSLRPLLDAMPTEDVATFLDRVTAAITDHNGMGHFVLPVPVDSKTVTQVRDHFDILVALRSENGSGEHRWEFVAEDRTTEWLEL